MYGGKLTLRLLDLNFALIFLMLMALLIILVMNSKDWEIYYRKYITGNNWDIQEIHPNTFVTEITSDGYCIIRAFQEYSIGRCNKFFAKRDTVQLHFLFRFCTKQCKYTCLAPGCNYMFKVNNRNTRTWYAIYSKLTRINFEHISLLALVFPLLTLNMSLQAGTRKIHNKTFKILL